MKLFAFFMFGAETLSAKKEPEKMLDVAELTMLRWMCGVTKMDRIRNDRIRAKVGEIYKEM